VYAILFADSVIEDLLALPATDYSLILDRIDEQLIYQPTTPTNAKKIIVGLQPAWEHIDPTWQLRVQEYRVFYDVDETKQEVVVAIRHKPPHKTTEEIL
jgi:mRNA-degrading endonuclease RelE of RelBE toxin-antitoxin system